MQMNRPQIPLLQVTVPAPTHSPPSSTTTQSRVQRSRAPVPSSPLSPTPSPARTPSHHALPPSGPPSPRAVFAQAPPYSPSTFSLSTETLVGSPGGSKGGHANSKDGDDWSPQSSSSFSTSHGSPSSPSVKNLQLAATTDDLAADPENDRLMPATPGLAGSTNFWKRFSTVVHENERKEAIAEKVGGKKAARQSRARSSWLEKTNARQKSYRISVGVVAFCIIAAIAGGSE